MACHQRYAHPDLGAFQVAYGVECNLIDAAADFLRASQGRLRVLAKSNAIVLDLLP